MYELVKKILGYSSAITAFVYLCGLLYCWVYAYALGIEGKITFTYYDYISAFINKPLFIIGTVVAIILVFYITPWIEDFKSESELINESAEPHKTRLIRNAPHIFFDKYVVKILIPFILLGSLIFFILYGIIDFNAIYFCFFILASYFVKLYFNHPNCPNNSNSIIIVSLILFISFAFFYMFSGYEDAIKNINSKERITINGMKYNLIKQFENGSLLKKNGGKLVYFSNNNTIELQYNIRKFPGLL